MDDCTCMTNRTLNFVEHPALLTDPWCPVHGESPVLTMEQIFEALHGKKHQSNEEE